VIFTITFSQLLIAANNFSSHPIETRYKGVQPANRGPHVACEGLPSNLPGLFLKK